MKINIKFQNLAFRNFLNFQKSIILKMIAGIVILTILSLTIILFQKPIESSVQWLSVIKLLIFLNTIFVSIVILILFRFTKATVLDKSLMEDLLLKLDIIFNNLFVNHVNQSNSHADTQLKPHENSKLGICIHKLIYFISHFRAFFLTILLLYIALTIKEISSLFNQFYSDTFTKVMGVVLFTLNNLTGCYIFRCFVELYLPSKKNPDKLRFHMNSFSLSIALALTVIYSASLIYGEKNIYKSGEIFALESSDVKLDSFVDLEKQIKYPLENKEVFKSTKHYAITTPSEEFIKQNALSITHSLNNNILISDTFHIDSHVINEETKNPNQVIKAYYRKSNFDTIQLKHPLKFAFAQKPQVQRLIVEIPSYLKIFKNINRDTLIKVLNFDIAEEAKQSFKAETLHIFNKPLIDHEEIEYTNLEVMINSAELRNGELIQYPEPIMLYREKPVGIMMNMFETISGLFNALAFALLIGRLDSKLISLKNYIIALLFLYAAIQPLFPFLMSNELVAVQVQAIILFLAFTLKLLLFFIILYVINTGRLLTYFYCFGELDKRADSIFANQFEFVIHLNDHHNMYSFSVNNNGQRVFNTVNLYQSLDASKKAISHFRELIKIASFKLTTHSGFDKSWLELIDDKDVLMYSKDFENNKIEEFREEVIENLPYCNVKILV